MKTKEDEPLNLLDVDALIDPIVGPVFEYILEVPNPPFATAGTGAGGP